MDWPVAERPLSPDAVREVYRRRAARYDLTSRLYGLLGFRLDRYRREAIAQLELRVGDTVVELGCGGVTLALADRKPWLSIERHMTLESMTHHYLGTTYVAVGVAGGRRRATPPLLTCAEPGARGIRQ